MTLVGIVATETFGSIGAPFKLLSSIPFQSVIPAKAGIHLSSKVLSAGWMPVFAAMTIELIWTLSIAGSPRPSRI
jgi:hypothetical protein